MAAGWCAVACLLSGAGPTRAQPPATAGAAQPTFRAEVSLVEVSAVVTGDAGRPVTDLTRDDFEVLEDGQRRPLVSARFLASAPVGPVAAVPPGLEGARRDEVVTNKALADAPAFVLLMDDLNVSPYDAHRAIRTGLGLLAALPADALVSVVTTSGEGGALVTLGRQNQDHAARVKAFAGRLVLAGPEQKNPLQVATTPSSVDAPCGVGSDVLNSPDCSDPTRAGRRAAALGAIGTLLSRTGSRRKVLVWLTTDMGVSPLAPESNREAQFAGLQRLLGGDVTLYAIDPRGNIGSFVAGGGGLGQGDRRTGGRMRVGPADTQFGGRGGSTITLDTDDMVGVPLTQLARETGGRWIQSADNVEKIAAEIVTQNTSAYVVAYESGASRAPGRHTIDVKVKRRGLKVSARRAFVVAESELSSSAEAEAPVDVTARLADVIRGGAPFGSLELSAHLAPQFAADGAARALLTVRVDDVTAPPAGDVDMLILAADDTGKVASLERFTMRRPPAGVPWEGSVTLTLERGLYQLRIAAAASDGTRTGLLLQPLDMRPPKGALLLGVPAMLGEDADGIRPTLSRRFPVGHPLAFQVEVGGEAVRRGIATLDARLVDATGTDVARQAATLEPAGSPAQARATAALATEGLAPGTYALVVEARGDGGAASHVVPVTLEPPTAAASVPRDITALAVAHGPFTRHAQRGPQVIRTEQAWRDFWRMLPTRQAAPDVDFSRAVLLAIVSDGTGPTPGTPRVTRVEREPGGVVVRWTTDAAAPGDEPSAEPRRPFVVVGLTGQQGQVRFERVD